MAAKSFSRIRGIASTYAQEELGWINARSIGIVRGSFGDDFLVAMDLGTGAKMTLVVSKGEVIDEVDDPALSEFFHNGGTLD